MQHLVATIFASAREKGISQKELAARAGVAEATLSRLKHQDSLRTSVLASLANSVGLRLALVAAETPVQFKLRPGWSSETGWISREACQNARLVWPEEDGDEFRL